MNKTSKKRAFFVVFAICLFHISVACNVTGFFSMRRVLPDHLDAMSPMDIYAGGLQKDEAVPTSRERPGDDIDRTGETSPSQKTQEAPPAYTPIIASEDAQPNVQESLRPAEDKGRLAPDPAPVMADRLSVEPSLLIALPVICLAAKEGRIDKEGLIFSKKDAYNSGTWKKPLDILRDHDEEGVKVLLQTIGKNYLLEILRKEGIEVRPDVSPEQLITGKGYTVDKKKLLSLYHHHVADGYNDLFPFMLSKVGVIKTKAGFELVESPRSTKPAPVKEEEEWLMPNLANLPLRVAIEKLAAHTAKIKVYGSGVVIEQFPRPFERMRGESECSIQGRLYSQ